MKRKDMPDRYIRVPDFVMSHAKDEGMELMPEIEFNVGDEDWYLSISSEGKKLYLWDGKRFSDVPEDTLSKGEQEKIIEILIFFCEMVGPYFINEVEERIRNI